MFPQNNIYFHKIIVGIVWLHFCVVSDGSELLNIFPLFLLSALPLLFPVLRTLPGHKANICSLHFHPFGSFVASGSLDTNIKVIPAFTRDFPLYLQRLCFEECRNVFCVELSIDAAHQHFHVWAGVFVSACEIRACIFTASLWMWLLWCGMWLLVRCQPRPGVSKHRCPGCCGSYLLPQAGVGLSELSCCSKRHLPGLILAWGVRKCPWGQQGFSSPFILQCLLAWGHRDPLFWRYSWAPHTLLETYHLFAFLPFSSGM